MHLQLKPRTPETFPEELITNYLIIRYELEPNKTSKILAHNFIAWLEDQPPPYLSRNFMEAGCRWMNGHDMCDALGLGRPSLYYYAVFAGHNVIVSIMARAQKLIPRLDRFIIQVSLSLSYMAGTLLTSS